MNKNGHWYESVYTPFKSIYVNRDNSSMYYKILPLWFFAGRNHIFLYVYNPLHDLHNKIIHNRQYLNQNIMFSLKVKKMDFKVITLVDGKNKVLNEKYIYNQMLSKGNNYFQKQIIPLWSKRKITWKKTDWFLAFVNLSILYRK